MLNRSERLVIIHNKEHINGPPLLKRSIDFQFNHYPITAYIVASPIIAHIGFQQLMASKLRRGRGLARLVPSPS